MCKSLYIRQGKNLTVLGLDSQEQRKSGKLPGVMRRGHGVGRLRVRARGITRASSTSAENSGRQVSGSSGSSRGQSSSIDEERLVILLIYTGCLSIFRFHRFSGMNLRVQFQISWVGASLFSEDTVYVYVLMTLYSNELFAHAGLLIVNLYQHQWQYICMYIYR